MATYTVRPGDTLTTIAQRFNVTPIQIARANAIQDPNLIQVDQNLIIPDQERLPGEAMAARNMAVAESVGDLKADSEAGEAWGQLFGPLTEEEIQEVDVQEVPQAKIAEEIISQEQPLLPMEGGAAPSQIPTAGPTGSDMVTVEGRPGVQTVGGLTSLITGEPQVVPEAPDPLKDTGEAAPAVSPETAAEEVAAIEPAAPPTEELTIDQAVELNPKLKDSINAYRQFATDFLALEPDTENVTITRNQIKEMDQQITGYNNRIQAIAEERAKPFFGKEDTGRKFLAAIAAGLGAYAAAMTGTRNFALDTINAAIEQDLQQQRDSKEFRLRDLEGQRALLLERRGELLQYAQNLISANLKLAKDQGVVAGNLAQVEQAQQRIEQDAIKNQQDLVLQIAKTQATALQKRMEGYFPGFGYTPLRGESLKMAIKDAAEFQKAEDEMRPRVEEAIKLIRENPVVVSRPGELRDRAIQLLDSVRLSYKNNVAKIGAAATKSEMDNFLDGVLPNFRTGATISEAVFGTVVSKLTGFLKDMDRDRAALVKRYEFTGGQAPPTREENSGIPGAQAGVR
jgi:LysM repeat protein